MASEPTQESEHRKLVALQSVSHTITVTCKGVRYKLFKILFGPKGDVYVLFPYYKDSNGLVGQAFLKPESTSVLLGPDCAKVTSHSVKFSHHMSGEALFSLTGKVRTEIRKQSLPLEKINGHLFTVMIQGIEGFDEAPSTKYDPKNSTEESVINFDVNTLEFEALKFVALWNPFEEVAKSISKTNTDPVVGPKYIRKSTNGSLFHGFMLSPEPGNPLNGRYLLSLGLTSIPRINKTEEVSLSFIGGFDQNIANSDPSKDYSFLVFIYPHVHKTGEGTVTFETIDLSLS